MLATATLIAGCIGARLGRGSPPRRELDIQALLDAAPSGNILTISYGEYILKTGLKLTNRQDLTITAPPGTRIFVDDVMEDVLALEDCDSVRIENLHLRHLKPLTEYECNGACLRLSRCRNMEVVGCELDGCGAFGIAGDDVNELKVTNCYVHNNSFSAFYFDGCQNALISGNRIVQNAELISQYSSDGIELRDNQMK